MSRAYLAIILVASLSLSGCAALFGKGSEQAQEATVPRATETDVILACVAENKKFSRTTFNEAYKTALADATRPENAELPPLVCLSLHQRASYKQFRAGMETLASHIKAHPESAPSLQGLLLLQQRLNKEKIVKWAQGAKSMDEKEGLEADNKELLERNETLERNAAQDQTRIKELQQQIEQLKNIENIIKNRER